MMFTYEFFKFAKYHTQRTLLKISYNICIAISVTCKYKMHLFKLLVFNTYSILILSDIDNY